MTRESTLRYAVAPPLAAALAAALLAACAATPATEPAPVAAVSASRSAAATPAQSTGSASPAASPAGPNPANPAMPGGRTVTVTLTGDVLLHSGLVDQARADGAAHPAEAGHGLDFRPLLGPVEQFVAGSDLAVCNLETPLAPPGGPYKGYPVFAVPQEIVPALVDTGFDACTTSSNHSVDGGVAGIQRTLDAMDAGGLRHTGSARTAAEASTPLIMDAHGIKVAVLSYAYGLNGFQLPADRPWEVNLIDTDTILRAARAARAAGAQIVMVALHAGTEYQIAPTGQQRSVAAALAASGEVDLVYGHHAHVVQPIDRIGSTWVVYGLGNFVASQHIRPNLAATSQHEAMVRFTFTEGGDGRFAVTRAEARPLAMTNVGEPQRVVDLATLLADPQLTGARRTAYQRMYDAAVKSLTTLGADGKGLVVAGR